MQENEVVQEIENYLFRDINSANFNVLQMNAYSRGKGEARRSALFSQREVAYVNSDSSQVPSVHNVADLTGDIQGPLDLNEDLVISYPPVTPKKLNER